MKYLTTFLLIMTFSVLFGQGLIELPNEFKDNAYFQVEKLTDFGIRSVGSEGELKTINYLVKYFKDLNLKPVIDTFNFQGFITKNIALYINNIKIKFHQIYFDPYKDSTGFKSEVYIFNPDSGYKSKNLETCFNKSILTKDNADVYRLNNYNPKAIIILVDTVFNNIRKDTKTCSLEFHGSVKNFKSYNIYCSINNKSDKEISIGAHWDSYNGAGADDNASGVSVILELARYFNAQKNNIPVNLKFILFGAEELGEMGSKAYTLRHIADTSSTLYYLNVDCVGDTAEIIADINCGVTFKRGNVYSNYTDKLASCDYYNQWRCIEMLSEPLESNVPQWLNTIMTEVLTNSRHRYIKTCYIGSDHRSFSLAGFVATHIGINGENVQHCPEDNIKQVNKNSLLLAGRIVASTIIRTVENINNNAY